MAFVKNKKPATSFQIIILGFLAAIILGTALLMLPWATAAPSSATFLEALFTSTSAICVTGLVVQDTATYWTPFGQIVILSLIQIGGLGVVTMAGSLAMIAGRKIGLFQRNTMQEAIAAHSVGGVVRLTRFILTITLSIELLGAISMAPVFCSRFGLYGLFLSLFHSISAFCNAGFDLMGNFSSLTAFSQDGIINFVVILLIISGGLGFLTWDDIHKNGLNVKKYRMQSKVILCMVLILILIPFLYFYFIEFTLPQWEHLTTSERFWGALFQAVTPRTAGFNTLDYANMSQTGQLMTILLMLVGGAPGSTAGGMKTTTFAVLVLSAISVYQRKENVQCFGRRIADTAVKNAAAIFFLYFLLFITTGMIISSIEQLPILTCLFETASAIGTVGLTLGITSSLGNVSRVILIILMYLGRVGGLTMIYATVAGHRIPAKYPLEKITIG